MDSKLIPSLKEEIQKIFGRRILSSGDCNALSEDIFRKTGNAISANTLRRFFGLVTSFYKPSLATLTIFGHYCGFDSLEEFQLAHPNKEKEVQDHFKAGEVLAYLVSIFRNTVVVHYNDETFLQITKHTVQFLLKHPGLADDFQRAIARTQNGQDFYFEQFIQLDGLNFFYGNGLRYYLIEKRTTEAQIFGYSLLCARAFLSNDLQGVERCYQEVMKYRPGKDTHPFVCGRYFATQLFYAHSQKKPVSRILVEAAKVHSSLKQQPDNYRLFPAFEYVLSLALLLTGHVDESFYYSDYGMKHYPNRHSYVEQGFYQTLSLVHAVALAKTGERAASLSLFEAAQPSEFYFLTRKIDTILYLHLAQLLHKDFNKTEEQLIALIQETGYVKIFEIVRLSSLQP